MADQYRRLAVFVDRPSQGSFVWILLESTDDPAIWLDLETGSCVFQPIVDARFSRSWTAFQMNVDAVSG